MLKIGDMGIKGLCLGNIKIKKAYLGTDLVFNASKTIFLDYIESNGGAYINTELKPSYNYTVKIKYQYTQLNGTFNPIFGMRTGAVGTGNNLFWAGMHYTDKQVYLRFGGDSVNYALGDKALDVIEMTCSPEGIFINSEDTGAIYFDGEITSEAKPMYLFTINGESGANGGLGETNAKVYSYQVFDGDMNLIQDLRPCIDPKGVVCMYDMVTKKYFYNQGTGTLIAGNKINFVDYIIFDGESWIDIDYIPSSNTRVVGKVSFTQWHPTAGANYVFGVYGDSANFGFNVGSNREVMNVPWGTSAGITFSNTNTFGQVYSFDISKNGTYLDGVLKLNASQLSAEFTATKSFYVGWSNGTSTQKLIGNIYPMQIYENDVLEKDLRPCIINDVAGLYDMVTCKFHTNIGTGTLKPSGRFVKSILFDGASYIDTGVIPSNNMAFEAGVMFSMVQSTNLSIISSRDGEKRYQPIGAIQNKWSASIGGMYDENGSPVSANIRYDLRSVVSNGGSVSLYSENTLVSSATSSGGIPTKSLYLFARNYSPIDSYVTGKLYYCKILDNGVLVQDLRPYVDENGVACFKDVVTNTLFYNQGGGELGYSE